MTDSTFRPVRLAAVASAAAAVLALSGCSGDAGGEGSTSAASEASASPSASSTETAGGGSGSPSASPSSSATGSYEPATSEGPAKNVPVPEEMPEAVKAPTEEGLEAAVEYWWATNFHLRETGDPAPFATISSEDCELCANQVDRWVKVYGDEAWVATDSAAVKFQFTDFDEESTRGTTAFLVSEAPGEIYLEDGERVEEASGDGSEDRPWTAALHFDENAGHWMIDEIGTAS